MIHSSSTEPFAGWPWLLLPIILGWVFLFFAVKGRKEEEKSLKRFLFIWFIAGMGEFLWFTAPGLLLHFLIHLFLTISPAPWFLSISLTVISLVVWIVAFRTTQAPIRPPRPPS